MFLLLRSCAYHFSAIGALANKFASTYYTKITPAVCTKAKPLIMIMDIIIIRDIFTFPPNLPLTKGGLWQGGALLAYGDGGY